MPRFRVVAVALPCVLTFACTDPASDPGGSAGTTTGTAGNVATAGSSSGASGAGSGGGGGGMTAGGSPSTSGAGGSGGEGTGGSGSGTSGTGGGGSGPVDPALAKFSFFLTSLASIKMVSGSDQGFGGDLRFGEEGEGAGLRGADKICKAIAEIGMPGAGAKEWRAFLSTTTGGPNGGPVHAKTRIGNGPWFDAAGRPVSMTLEALIGSNRPGGADPAIKDDLPNEFGIPNHMADAPGCVGDCPDNHQTLTGTNCVGELYTGGGNASGQNEITPDCTGVTPPNNTPNPAYTCNDWTSKEPEGDPWCGHSWPRNGSGLSWMSAAKDGGCAPCVRVEESGGVNENCVGSAGGYGGFYCFEYKP